MKLSNAQIFDLAFSLEGLMEKQLPVRMAYRLSQIFLKLESHRRSIALVIEKLPKNEDGMPEQKGFQELLEIENEVEIQPIESQEIFDALDSISPKEMMALLPILKEGGL